MPEYLQTKVVNSALGLILIFIIAALTLTYIAHNPPPTSASRQPATESSRFEARHEIKGFRFDSIKNGRPIFSVMADRISIEKKKIGFLRFALMKEARLENGFIKLFKSDPGPEDTPHNQDFHSWKFDAGSILPKVLLSSMPVKNISGVSCEPVTVEFYDTQLLHTRIQADSATITGKKHKIRFKGNVSITSEGKTLKAGKVTFNPDNVLFTVDGPFQLHNQKRQIEGTRLTADLFLTPLKYKLSSTSRPEMVSGSRDMKGSDL
jgi:hypothetical protein